MQIENSISLVTSSIGKSNLTQFNQKQEAFRDIFERKLKNRSGSHRSRIELTGILVPCERNFQEHHCKFKLETASTDYFLFLNEASLSLARKIEWEEVSVKGYLNPIPGLFEVEKICLAQKVDPPRLSPGPLESLFDLEYYKRTISRRGRLDLAPDYIETSGG